MKQLSRKCSVACSGVVIDMDPADLYSLAFLWIKVVSRLIC